MSEVSLIHVVPVLDDKTAQIAEQLWSSYKHEYCYPYSHFVDGDVTLEDAKTFIQALKRLGIVKTYHGLMDDEGNVAGSGFGVPSNEAFILIELALYRYNYNDSPLGRPSDYVPKRITIGDYSYKLEDTKS